MTIYFLLTASTQKDVGVCCPDHVLLLLHRSRCSEPDEVIYRIGDTGAGLGCIAGFTSVSTAQLQTQLCKKAIAQSCFRM